MGYLEIHVDKDDRDFFIESFDKDGALYKAIQNIPDELKLKNEQELADMITPTPVDYAMKKNFWDLFVRVRDQKMQPLQSDIYNGVCRATYFYQCYVINPARIAWMIHPPTDSFSLVEEAFAIAFRRVKEDLLTMPVTDKSAPVLLKLFTYLADRKLGPMLHRIETRNLHVGVNMPGDKQQLPTTPAELEAQMDKIKKKLTDNMTRDVKAIEDAE